MSEINSAALVVGGEVKVVGLAVCGRLFIFSPMQMQFLVNLQRLKEPVAAALSIGKDEEWSKKFLGSRKFREYLSCKMQEYSIRNGMTVEWWYLFGKQLTEGERQYYRVTCRGECGYKGEMTTYEAESHRTDEMDLVVPCPGCYKPLELVLEREKFEPSREQVEGWKELGSRLIPKVERVQHQFSKEEFVFESEGGA